MERVYVNHEGEIEEAVFDKKLAVVALDGGVIEIFMEDNGFINCSAHSHKICMNEQKFYEWNDDVVIWIETWCSNFVNSQ